MKNQRIGFPTHSITVRTTRKGGKRLDFIADIRGKREGNTITTAGGIKWKV
jgi:hypothetical protein